MNARSKRLITMVWAGILALGFLFAGVMKLIGPDSLIANMNSWNLPVWTRFPIGLVEITLGILMIIPKTRRLAIFGTYIWMIGALYVHLQATPMQIDMIGGPITFGVFATALLFVSGMKTKE